MPYSSAVRQHQRASSEPERNANAPRPANAAAKPSRCVSPTGVTVVVVAEHRVQGIKLQVGSPARL